MTVLKETARAKVNLLLHVTGRRPDGYHQLVSLVAFAKIADIVSLEPVAGTDSALHITGPFAAALATPSRWPQDNAVVAAAEAWFAAVGRQLALRITLEKNLPVAAGIGGGSADAAAVMRLLQRIYPAQLSEADLKLILCRLGADVPVAYHDRAAVMSGIGEQLHALTNLPVLQAVLVNPNKPVSTPAVFQALCLGSSDQRIRAEDLIARVSGAPDALLAMLAEYGNDLEHPAMRLLPEITDILEALQDTPDIAVARMSGSGATCFGLYPTAGAAERAAAALKRLCPAWWCVATELNAEPA